MESRAESPPKLAPYPTLVGTAMTGQSTRPPTTEARAPSHPGHGHHTAGAHEHVQAGEQAVEPRYPHVVEPGDAVAHGLGGEGGLLGYRYIAGAAGGHHDVAQRGPGAGEGDAQPGGGVILQRESVGHLLGGAGLHAGDEDVAASRSP